MNVIQQFESLKKSYTKKDLPFPLIMNGKPLKPSDKRLYYYEKIPKSIDVVLTDEEYKFLGCLTYKMISDNTGTRAYDEGWAMSYIPMSSEFLRMVIGGNYNAVLNHLLELEIIEVYTTASGVQYSPLGGMCKCFRYTSKYIDDIRSRNFNKRLNTVVKLKFNNTEKETLQIKGHDADTVISPVLQMVLDNYKNVTLDDSWQESLWGLEKLIEVQGDIIEESNLFRDRSFALQIGKGNVSISTKHTGRIFHPTILMRREMRPFVRYNGNKVVEIDVKACHPVMIGKFANLQDRERWLQVCISGEIYEMFIDEEYKSDPNIKKEHREIIKKQFQQAISYSPNGKSKKAQEIINYIEQEFPSIYEWLANCWKNCEVKNEGNSPQFILQSLESKIFIKNTFEKLYDEFWMLPQHDGFLVEEENYNKLKDKLNKAALKELGYKFTVTKK